MDTKRLIVAIVLSIVVIVVYQALFVKPAPQQPVTPPKIQEIPPPEAKSQAPSPDIGALFSEEKKSPPPKIEKRIDTDLQASEEQEYRIETELFIAIFTNKGAGLKSFVLKKYKDDQGKPLDLVSNLAGNKNYGLYPLLFFPSNDIYQKLNNVHFSCESQSSLALAGSNRQELVFKFADKAANLYAEKRFIVSGNSYRINLGCEVVKEGATLDAPVVFGPDLENNVSSERSFMAGLKIMASKGEDLDEIEFAKVKTQKSANSDVEKSFSEIPGFHYWASYQTTYFAVLFKLDSQTSKLEYKVIRENLPNKKVNNYFYMVAVNPGTLFLGPKDEEVLSGIESEFFGVHRIIEYGWFGSIARIMLKGINFIHHYVPNYGWAIIFFTIFLKIILFPLTYSSSVSMAKMQTLQPKIKAIRKKYKGSRDPQQRKMMNVEIMALYKEEKVNPAGGCLPLLLQLPILWGFFRLLSVSINVRHEPWILWITDLSKKDPLYVLPILMGITQLIIQRMTPSGGDDTQKKLMYMMPVLMTVFFLAFPSGLNLYWFFTNLLQIGQQKLINEKIYNKKKDSEHERKALKRKRGVKEL